jgi:hypothetical protein
MAVQPRRDLDVRHPFGRIEDHPRALHIPPRRCHLARAPLELAALLSAQVDHIAAGPGHDDQFVASHEPPAHNPEDFRMAPLVEGLGLRISRSEVSRVCEALDEHVEAFRTRPLEGRYPYLFLDAKVGCAWQRCTVHSLRDCLGHARKDSSSR